MQKINIKQERLILALISEGSIESAAKKARVSKVTVYKYLKDPQFNQALRDRRNQIFDEAMEKLKVLTSKAVARLTILLKSKDESVARLSSKIVLDSAFRGIETVDFEERLSRIEEVIREKFFIS